MTPEERRQRAKERYASDPEFRARMKARNKAYYERNAEKVKAKVKAHRAANPRWQWGHNLKRYAIDIGDWDALLVAQSGRCAICADPMSNPHVDHCHETGAVRGLLCSHCNTGLGQFRDRPDLLRSAIGYLTAVPWGHG